VLIIVREREREREKRKSRVGSRGSIRPKGLVGRFYDVPNLLAAILHNVYGDRPAGSSCPDVPPFRKSTPTNFYGASRNKLQGRGFPPGEDALSLRASYSRGLGGLGEGKGALRLPRDGADFDPKLRG
jgi:hypothetical protein